jgi:fatty acid desaturase
MSAVQRTYGIEWPTLALLAATYGLWLVLVLFGGAIPVWLVVPLLALTVTQHSSLQHEVIHGHPLPNRALSVALVQPAIGLFVPYGRFRDLHLAHHHDNKLTDPYDDPETAYLDPAVWVTLPRWFRRILLWNNTLLGRMIFGPVLAQYAFMRDDWRMFRAGSLHVAVDWLVHLVSAALVSAFVLGAGTVHFGAYVLACYLGLSVLKIRTYLEHQAHEHATGRSVIIEDRGPLALLFLNNNYHSIHHAHPQVAWYDLPGLFNARREHYLRRNRGYYYRSYRDIFASHFLKAKEPVPHPLYPQPGSRSE